MKITILYDNETLQKNLRSDWGFSCLVEVDDKRILFDTGANGAILLGNMRTLKINPTIIDEVVISHEHWDHTGGLATFLKINPVPVYTPVSCRDFQAAPELIRVSGPAAIHKDIYLTGELKKIEQSLIINTAAGLVIVVGCSHPGVDTILNATAQLGKPIALIGGLHGFNRFELLRDLHLICPTHCTQYISEIKSRFPDKYIQGGAGKVIEL